MQRGQGVKLVPYMLIFHNLRVFLSFFLGGGGGEGGGGTPTCIEYRSDDVMASMLQHSDGSTDPLAARNCLEPVSMTMNCCDVTLRYSIWCLLRPLHTMYFYFHIITN